MLGLIDLEISNIQSVRRALEKIGVVPAIVGSATDLDRVSAVILPGVGAFGDGMASLQRKRLVDPLRDFAKAQPVVGICLGMQLLGSESTEHGVHEGLGIIPGRIERLEPSDQLRVPHIGWSEVEAERPHALVPPDVLGGSFYFVHSYHFRCNDASDVVASADLGTTKISAVVGRGVHLGVQFHPEKSQDAGLDLLASIAQSLASQAQPA